MDWLARYEDLNSRIDFLETHNGLIDETGNMANYTPELQSLMKKRDEITKLIKSLEDMDGEGYNGKYDPAFEPLIKSLVEETKQGGKFVDGIQTVLDLAGFIPGAGEVADGLNALISLLRGDYVDAGLSAAAMIPFAGWASGAGKLAKRFAKAADAAGAVTKHTDDIVDAGQAVARYTDDAADLSDSAVKQLEDQLVYNWYNSKEPDILGNTPKVNTEGAGENVTYRRVQGGSGNNASRQRISINPDNSISISNKNWNLSVSIDNGEHSSYFRNSVRGTGDTNVLEFDVPKWFDDFLQENTIPQKNYWSNPLNMCRK